MIKIIDINNYSEELCIIVSCLNCKKSLNFAAQLVKIFEHNIKNIIKLKEIKIIIYVEFTHEFIFSSSNKKGLKIPAEEVKYFLKSVGYMPFSIKVYNE